VPIQPAHLAEAQRPTRKTAGRILVEMRPAAGDCQEGHTLPSCVPCAPSSTSAARRELRYVGAEGAQVVERTLVGRIRYGLRDVGPEGAQIVKLTLVDRIL
jgi:hypothetical protein